MRTSLGSRAALGLLLGALALAAGQESEATSAEGTVEAGEAEQKGKGDKESDESRKEQVEGKSFCEADDCYELLGVTRESGPIPIKRAYRRLAAEWHPDKCPSGDFVACREKFPKYANAYEILSNPEMRKNYNYLLDHPYEFPGFYMKYSRPKYAPKTDLRIVLVLTLMAAAGVQYLLKQSMYEEALAKIKKDPRARYQERLKEVMAREEKAIAKEKKSGAQRGDAGSTKHNKSHVKPEELEKRKKAAEETLNAELAAELPPPPSITDNVAVGVFKAPLTIAYTCVWAMRGGMREPAYMTRKAFGMSEEEWAAIDEAEQQELIRRELWVADNMVAYEEEVVAAEGSRTKSGREKREQRLRKKMKRDPATPVIED